ncbi:hypothetical protein EV401DRAFT_1892703, partial [Pisolithus croceorrhizus]
MHVDVPVDAIIPDGVPSYDAMPELTSVMREPPSWHVGFFGGVWKRLVGNVPASGVLVTLDSMINMIKRVWQESKEGRTRMMIDVLLLLQEKAIKHDETLPRNTWRSCMQANAEGMQNQKSPQVVAMPALPMAFTRWQGGDNYEAAYAESSIVPATTSLQPMPQIQRRRGWQRGHTPELGGSQGRYDWEEESGGEFEDPLYIWPLEEYCQVGEPSIAEGKKVHIWLKNTFSLDSRVLRRVSTAQGHRYQGKKK